jgi:hypothetical protein
MLSLSEALKSGRLSEFVDQEEKRGVGPANRKDLDAAIEALAKQPRSTDQTSRSPSRGGLTEK